MVNEGVDRRRRRLLTAATSVVGGVGCAFAAVPFLASFQPSARTRAIGAPVEIDIGKLEAGQRVTAQWRGKPIWIVRRTPEAVEALATLDDELRDPQSEVPQQPPYAQNRHRSIRPELLVVVGICTHLGCSPTYVTADDPGSLGEDWRGGFFCPCHGSTFDLAGRVFKGVPAPTNLVVPPYQFVSDTVIVVGVDEGTA